MGVMLKTTPQKVLESVQQLMLELHEKANAPVTFDVVEPELEPQPEQNSNVPSHIQEQVKQQMEQMRVDHLPSKLTAAIAALSDKSAESQRVNLSVSRITDVEMKQIAEALQGNDVVTHLDLSHNEVGDLGVQALVTAMAMGAAKNLQELRLSSN